MHAVQDVLDCWHAFFDFRGFHNHTAHHILALWAFGANRDIIEPAYEEDKLIQRPAFKSPEPITIANFTEHWGMKSKLPFAFLSGLIHSQSMGFQIPYHGIFAEDCRTSGVEHSAYFALNISGRPSSFREQPSMINSFKFSGTTRSSSIGETSALKFEHPCSDALLRSTVMLSTTMQPTSWSLDTADSKDVDRKIEELQWMNALIYAVAVSKDGKGDFSADFLNLSMGKHSHNDARICVFVARGCPSLDIDAFFGADIVGPASSVNSFSSSPRLNLPPTPPFSNF
ncbi:hypothetical protein D9757_012064 [Collybiopsis confluens]|uniref:Uncharacterized protein n=1 Tax=Collybiopsis confluens TaxID=2823264 RepID=A0A8H5D0L0_9AGAR|nr:hypothetical protein D9757_012064 [Collybiopsis confluens]